jgi:ADP-ribose pyrophosphatase YjhB (NUDIX family)
MKTNSFESIKNNNTCNNCGKSNHQFHMCKLPIISYGIILFRQIKNDNEVESKTPIFEYLMIRRKDSFGYIDLIRGKYTTNNVSHIQQIVNEMSIEEKNGLLDYSFDDLWKTLWGEQNGFTQQYRNEEILSFKKFELLKNGINQNNNVITLENIISNSDTKWEETEWEFPKGRRNTQEKDLECAIREFEEETGYTRNDIKIVENILPFEEIFIGSNHKSYKHKYFLAYLDSNKEPDLTNFQKSEVSKLEWKTIDECLKCIRPYHLEKKQIISNINTMLLNYKIVSTSIHL